jgi:hypothetical protein
MSRKLRIEIDEATGELAIDIDGYVGASCEEAVRLIEAVMGRPAPTARRKAAYHARPAPTARAGGRPGAGGRHG